MDFDHAALSYFEKTYRLGQWEVFLNVLKLDLQKGASGADLREVFFGRLKPSNHPRYHVELSDLRLQTMRLLMWAGFTQKADRTTFQRL